MSIPSNLGHPTEMATKKPLPDLILASGSPRRRELLQSLGLNFEVILPTVDEKTADLTGMSPEEQVKHLAHFKGQSIARDYPNHLVIAADTIVVVGDRILGKPEDAEDACRMLQAIQGREHSVFSAIAVFYQGQIQCEALETRVFMRPLTPEEIRRYVETGEPMDKAGSYAIQGIGSTLVDQILGCYFNVVGMSLVLLDRLLRNWDLYYVL